MTRRIVFAACLMMGLMACNPELRAPVAIEESNPELSTTGIDGRTAPLLEGIGPLHFEISTNNALAQQYFNQALTLAYGFNHAEAVRSFREAARLDPTCGICYWGVALALGPNINAPMGEAAVAPAWEAIQQAKELKTHESTLERAYIDTLATRYSEDGSDRAALDAIYAGAMAGLVDRYPDDLNARTLLAEALMDLSPWAYWQDDGSPKDQNTVTLVEQLEYVIDKDPSHPGALHLYIHAMERFTPKKAEAAADRLGPLVPVAGHLVHMPSHIYLRVGRYSDAVDSNAQAALADEDYIAQCNAQGLYPAQYYPHNIHFLWYSAMMEGRKALAIENALRLRDRVPVEVAKSVGALQRYMSVPVFTYLRFGMWQEVIKLDVPGDDLPYAKALSHYGRGVAFASLGNTDAANEELGALNKIASSGAVDELPDTFPGVTPTLMDIAAQSVVARIARARGAGQAEIEALEAAVALQDGLPYIEPPFWHYPIRQTLGSVQLREGHASDALTTFKEDLEKFPMNPWSLYGLETAQIAVGEDARDTQTQREHAWRNADIDPIINL